MNMSGVILARVSYISMQKIWESLRVFFCGKTHENPLTRYVIRANFVFNFGILKNCYRLWVTFYWSADEMFIKDLF